ncbi:DnaJ-domain-containing protein [Trichoderma citrinoviride]|uniref:DnaJ-domain-containing protein n=1 Tax=Trichoderma citrinoviride TaxID=58853 RepID=A0A2T4B2D6_9HYPO|nr:DnaJ-domain-containing protein [Trichoderma citrinoviride]PTB63487.1 DnaJ-domain-containing protein [Trichoderma citrinoviride]
MSSTPLPDHYKVLGVNKDAQVAEIRLAYRKLVLKCHPDKVQDPALKAQKQEEFQKVQQAYELLTDEEERRKYDDQVKLAELKEQLRKTSVSTPRSNSKYAEYEIRTAEPPRASSYKPATNVPPPAKGYTYPRSYEDDVTFSSRVYQTGSSRATRRETTYVDGRSKRDSEREAREKERDRERRKKADKEEAARREKEAKEAKDARREKRAKEKQRDKDIKRESEDKKKHTKPSATYVEDYSDEAAPAAKSDKKKSSSSSKKYDEKRDRDRSSHRDDIPVVSSPAPAPVRSFTEYATSKYVELPRTVPAAPEPSSSWEDTHAKIKDAKSYMEAARAKESVAPGGLKRSMTYGPRMAQPPAAPTPPPLPNQPSPFAAPHDDDVRRSAARPRRGSTESNRPGGDRYRKSSREPIPAEPVVMSASPNSRHAHPPMSGSPPHLSRTNTMPADASYPRAVPITRSQTYNFGDGTDPRGRNRTRFQSQIDEEDSDEVHDHRARDRRHHGGRREHSVDPVYTESRYPYERQTSYSRRPEPEPERYAHYSSGYDSRPAMPARDTSYSTSGGSGQFAKVKTSKNYGYDDVHYSAYHHQKPREEYTYA